MPPCDRLQVTRGPTRRARLGHAPSVKYVECVRESSRCRLHVQRTRERVTHLWAASTGLPGLRCASMPFADEVIFNLWPGVAASWFRALGALLVVAAAVDMEGQHLRIITRASSVDRDAGRWGGGRGACWERGQQRWTLKTARAGDEQQERGPQRSTAAEGTKMGRLWESCQMPSWVLQCQADRPV